MNKTIQAIISSLFMITATTGCGHTGLNETVPAVLASPNDSSHRAIKESLSKLIGQEDVLLAPDAFVTSSVITLEKKPLKDQSGNLIQGRVLGMSTKVQMIWDGSSCHLTVVGEGRSEKLSGVDCKPEKS